MKKLIGICGDSFMSQIEPIKSIKDNGSGKHFIDILSNKLDCKIINLSRGASSNEAIRLQIDEVIKYKPDYVLIGLTSVDRMIIPLPNRRFERSKGLHNISHERHPDKSAKLIRSGFVVPSMITNNILSLINKDARDYISDDMLDAVEKYFTHLYDYDYKTLQDTWIISDGLSVLNQHNVKYSLINSTLHKDLLKDKSYDYIDENSPLNPWIYWDENDDSHNYPFHISYEKSLRLGNLWYDKFINEIFKDG